jgi:8-oxo-dGTP diphosphatase
MAKKQIPFNPADNPVRKQSLELAKKADKTLGYNREVVEETGLGQEAVYTGLQAYYAPKEAGFFDPYEDYVDKNTLRGGEFNVDELNKIRAANQSNWQQARHAVARVATNIVPQIVSGFASMVDIPGYFSAEEAANNEIVNWAQDLKKTVDEDWFPIYEEEPQSMNISDPAWWMSRGSGLVESIGSFAATGLVGGKLISGGLKGIGAITKGKDLTRAIIGAKKSKNLLTGASTVTNAVAMNQAESVISATQVFKDTYQEKLDQGWKKDKAKQAASEAAATTMQLNKINILFNLTSARAFVSPLKSSREILKKATGLGKVGHVAIEGGQEAAEELVNLVAEKAGTAKGKQESYTLNDALKDINTMEGFEAAFLGALGGMGQTGITSASEYSKYGAGSTKDEAGNRISKVAYENNKYAQQQEVIDSLIAKGVKVTDIMQNFKDNVLFQEKLEKAREKGDTAEIQKLQEDMLESKAIKAFQSGTTEILENLYKEEAAQDPEVVGQEHINRANDAIVQIKELEAIYNNFEDYGNVDEIFFNRANKNRATRNAKYIEQLKKQADFELNKDLHSIADKYSYDRERDILIKEDGKVVRTDKVMEKVPLSYASSDLETNQGKTEAEQKVYDKFLNEVKALESYKKATSYAEQLSTVEKVITENDKEFSEITSKKYQETVVAKKAKEAAIKEGYEVVKQSTSIAEIQKLKAVLEDPAFDKVADAKIADLQKSNDIAAKQKQVAVVLEKFQQRIKNATQEELNAITAELDAAELSQKNKTTLTLAIQKRSDVINGVTTAEEDPDEDNPLFKYNSKDPAELEAEVEQEKESFDTEIPTDLPNPETEKTDVEGAVADAAEKLAKEDKTLIIGEDAQGNLVYGYSRSSEGYNRAAFLSREMNQTETTGRIDREEFTDKLEDNLDLLNPDFLIAGTPLNMQVDTEYEGDKYDPTSNTRQKIPWVLRQEALQKQADAQGIPLTSLPEYIAEVPIKVTNDAGDIVFYVHDNAWYRAENLSATAEEIAEDKAKNFKIREAIIKKGTPVKTKVSYKSFGKLFKSSSGEAISVSEAMPDPNLILAVGRNGAIEFSGDVSKILKGGTLLKTNIEDGRAYAIVKVGPKEYLPIPLEKTPLSPEVINSIMFAVEAYLTGDVDSPIVKAIAKSPLSVDITTFSGLAEYLGQFIYLFPTKGTRGLENYLIKGGIGTNLKSNRPLISINPTGLEFGRPGITMGSYAKPDGTTVVKPSIKLSPNFKSKAGAATNAAGLIKLRALLESGNILSNVDRKVLAKNTDSTLILDEEGNTTSQKYSDQIKQSHKTNILSVNVGTEDAPVWAYTIQPTILFDTAFAGVDSTKKAKAATPKLKVTPAQKTTLNYKGVNPTVDVIVTKVINGEPHVLIIKRGTTAEAEANKLAFPGGFQDTDAKKGNKWKAGKETAEQAAVREVKEETGLDLEGLTLEKVGVFDAQDRDPRNSNTSWVSSTVYKVNIPEGFAGSTEVSGKDDAQEARWIPVSELSTTDKSQFGFDHADILESENLVYFKEEGSAPTSTDIEAKKADAQTVKNRMQEIEKQPVSINVTTDASNKMEQTSEEVVLQIKAELDKIGLPYSDVVANDKGSTYFVVTKDGQQHEILKLVKTGNALVKPVLTKAKWINHLIKTQPEDLYKFVDAELAALGTPLPTSDIKLSPTDKIIWGHPGLGKTTFREQNPDKVLDFDTDFKPFVAKKLGLPINERNSVGLNKWRKENGDEEFNKVMRDIWTLAKNVAKEQNKMLIVSDMIFLRENASDFDKVITTSKEAFVKRATERGDDAKSLESWKSSIDKTIAGIDQSKVVSTDKYFSELASGKKEIKTTPEQEVETLTGEALIEAYAQDIVGSGYPLSAIEGILENLDLGAMPLEAVLDMGFTSLEEAKAAFAKAKEIFIANSKETKTITLPNGLVVKVDKNTKDTTDISDDEVDELIPEMTEEQLNAQRDEIDEMIIRGIDSATQSSLIAYLSSDIITQALAAKEVDGKKKVKAGAILDKHLIALKELSRFYKDQDLPNKAARLDAIVAQFDKVKRLVNQNMSKFSTGTVDETLELNDGEAEAGLVRTSYSDNWTFTLSSKSTASADLKKFFSIVRAQDEGGPLSNILGLPEILPYDTVDNTLKEILSNKPADYALLIDILELNVEKFPWIKSVIEQLENAPDKIKNEFVSDMTKHHVDMQFAMWSKDYNGNYSLQKWSSNASSIEQRLRSIWNSNLKGVATRSNLVIVNDEDEYVFNTEVGNALVAQAKEWAKNPKDVTNEELANWLGNFGIVLSDGTYNDLRNGKFTNKGRKSWAALFTNSAGLVKVLATALDENIQGEVSLKDANIINDSAVKSLAKLEAANSYNTYSNSFQAGGKTIYSYGNNNFLVNRMRDLTAFDEETGTFVNQELIEGLSKISFTKDSTWLGDLTNADTTGQLMRDTFAVKYLSIEALKKAFTRSQDNKKLNNLTTAEHEVTKIAFFQNNSGEILNGEQRRKVDFFYPTMSDKTTMLTISSLSREITLTDGEISDASIALLYNALVLPEINRIRDNQTTNIKGYEPNYFYFLNTLNTLPVTTGNDADGNPIQKSFLDIVKDKSDLLNSSQVKDAVNAEIKSVFTNLIQSKLADWKQLGIGETIATPQGKVTDKFTFLDSEYMSKVVKAGKGTTPVRYAAMDYVFNYLIANAEIYKLFVGDPALYAKFDSKKTLEENLKETFINLGKRLAGDIAPGIELADSANNKYYQVFLEDKEIASNNVKDTIQKEFFEKIVSTYGDTKKGYGAIEGSDAQEYTTWKEHLYIMKQLGRLTQAQYDKFYKKLEAQSRGDFRKVNKLTYEELGIVMQPLKPVYVGNRLSVSENVDSRVYIKSSSFPLLPELTAGLQIDKIRQGLETFEAEVGVKTTSDGVPAFVRASFGTANKVGAVKNSAKVFDDNGNVVDNFKISEENSLLLDRSNFRIQQDVPYKREQDAVNIGTQERKLLFVNTLDLEIEPGVKGSDLMELYNKNYEELFTYAKENLEERLGLVESTPLKADISSLLSIPDSTIFEDVEKFQEGLKGVKPIAKVQKQEEFAEEMGEATLERVNFINKNFNKIVEGLIGAKMNVFFDENNEFKKCE